MSNQKRKAVISGIGMITANGNDKEEVFSRCKEGITGLKKCTLFPSEKLKTPYVGQIDIIQQTERSRQILKKILDEALSDARLTVEEVEKEGLRASLSFATLLIGEEEIKKYLQEGQNLNQVPSVLAWLQNYLHVQGLISVDTAACSAGTTAIGMALDLIRENKADLVFAGGADPLSDFACFGFHALDALSQEKAKPFDSERDGINIGEGGAFLVVEEEEHALKRGAKIYAEVVEYGIGNDAYHITSPDPEGSGAIRAMEEALSGIDKKEVGYINAHGTGTKANDTMERKAIQKVFGDRKVAVSSTKAVIGHCLGASGAIESALTVMALSRGILLPTAYSTCEQDGNILYPTTAQKKDYRYALKNSFAFGGNTASILFKKYE